MIQPLRNDAASARQYAADCLAWRIDVPGTTTFLTGSALSTAVDAACDACAIDLGHAENIATLPDLGITARIDGAFVAAGTEALFTSLDIRLGHTSLQSLAQIRLRGNDAILVGGWRGVRQIVEIANPTHASSTAEHVA